VRKRGPGYDEISLECMDVETMVLHLFGQAKEQTSGS